MGVRIKDLPSGVMTSTSKIAFDDDTGTKSSTIANIPGKVDYTTAQTLTDLEKATARGNIGINYTVVG